MTKTYLVTAGVSGFLVVLLGALGSHLLASNLDPQHLNAFHIANQYQFYHTLALLALAPLHRIINATLSKVIYTLFLIGIIFFSFSIYLTSTMDYTHLGVGFLSFLAPIGGTSFMLGWIVIAWTGITYKSKKKSRTH